MGYHNPAVYQIDYELLAIELKANWPAKSHTQGTSGWFDLGDIHQILRDALVKQDCHVATPNALVNIMEILDEVGIVETQWDSDCSHNSQSPHIFPIWKIK